MTQEKVNSILREKWYSLSKEEKQKWKEWEQWDAKRHAHQLAIYNTAQTAHVDDGDASSEPTKSADDSLSALHVPKKRKVEDKLDAVHIPKKVKK